MFKASKKILSVLLVIVMITAVVPLSGFAGLEMSVFNLGIKAGAIDESGSDTTVDHDYQIVDSLEADCINDGYVVYKCADDDCDEGYTDVIVALGHEYGEWILFKEPSCQEVGMKIAACIRCETVKAQYLDKSEHTIAVYKGVEPTCNNTGLTEGAYCSLCGEVLEEQMEIPATGHITETIPGTPADCINSGLTAGEKCTVCGEVTIDHQPIPALDHDYVINTDKSLSATCTEKGYVYYECSRCFDEDLIDISELGHSFSDWTIENRFETRKCLTCGLVETRPIENCNHKTEVVKGIPADCTSTGISDGLICSICGTMIESQQQIPALGHNDEDADGICDRYGCNYDLTADCDCRCHKSGLAKLIFNMTLFFQKLFRLNRTCACGIAHY